MIDWGTRTGFGTHNWWAAFKGYLWAKLTLHRNVVWKTNHHEPTAYNWHTVMWDTKRPSQTGDNQ